MAAEVRGYSCHDTPAKDQKDIPKPAHRSNGCEDCFSLQIAEIKLAAPETLMTNLEGTAGHGSLVVFRAHVGSVQPDALFPRFSEASPPLFVLRV
jgi:hypothetical protein